MVSTWMNVETTLLTYTPPNGFKFTRTTLPETRSQKEEKENDDSDAGDSDSDQEDEVQPHLNLGLSAERRWWKRL